MIKLRRRYSAAATITRRSLLQTSALVGAGLMAPQSLRRRAYAQLAGGTPDPNTIPKYAEALVVPRAMPKTSTIGEIDYYEIAVRQFEQQVLPSGMPMTTVWSYGSVSHPETFNYPAFTIEAKVRKPVRVKWINDLVDDHSKFLPHLLPVDPTLHWANPPGGEEGRATRPEFARMPRPYTGPVPIVTHLHGGHSAQESDGYAEAWYLPDAKNIPDHFATEGTFYDFFRDEFLNKFDLGWDPGTATFHYDHDQPATTMWYHDHTLGMTRLNVYAGPAGFYLLRGGRADLPVGTLPGPAPGVEDDPFGRYNEIPLAVQDRSFNDDGALFYPDSREFFDAFGGPYIPDSDVPPIWNPEFFGNTIVVNGRTWPFLEVEPRRYRLRLLNGCNSRFLILKIVDDAAAERPARAAVPFWQIGADGGFLPRPVRLEQLLMAPAERADVIVDFTGLAAGTEIFLVNEGPDEPFGGGIPGLDFAAADPDPTGQVMQFRLVPLVGKDQTEHPAKLTLPGFRPLPAPDLTRQVSLNEEGSTVSGFDGPIAALLGVLDSAGDPVRWGGTMPSPRTRTWVRSRSGRCTTSPRTPTRSTSTRFRSRSSIANRSRAGWRPPELWETGLKDTVIAYPGEITRVKALYDRPGLFVWHCHIVEHEDNEMMRPYHNGPIPDVFRSREDHGSAQAHAAMDSSTAAIASWPGPVWPTKPSPISVFTPVRTPALPRAGHS